MTLTRIGSCGYNALDIAEYIIKYEDSCDELINNLKLQKILYFLQAQFIVTTGKTLFNDELIAWDCGPLVKSVWNEYKRYGCASIFLNKKHMRNNYIHSEHRELIEEFLEYIRPYSSTYLVGICHNQTPWKNARIRWNNVIDPYELLDYFHNDEDLR